MNFEAFLSDMAISSASSSTSAVSSSSSLSAGGTGRSGSSGGEVEEETLAIKLSTLFEVSRSSQGFSHTVILAFGVCF